MGFTAPPAAVPGQAGPGEKNRRFFHVWGKITLALVFASRPHLYWKNYAKTFPDRDRPTIKKIAAIAAIFCASVPLAETLGQVLPVDKRVFDKGKRRDRSYTIKNTPEDNLRRIFFKTVIAVGFLPKPLR